MMSQYSVLCVLGKVVLLNVILLSVWASWGHYNIIPEDKTGVKLTNEPVLPI